MRRHHTGSGRRTVIGPDWAAHHMRVVEGSLRGRVSLRVPGTTQTWSTTLQRNVLSPFAPYATRVPARVQSLTGQARVLQLAEDTEVVADYLVVVPAAQVVGHGHLVQVTECEDPALTGRTLRVDRAVVGTERFERDLFCTLDD